MRIDLKVSLVNQDCPPGRNQGNCRVVRWLKTCQNDFDFQDGVLIPKDHTNILAAPYDRILRRVHEMCCICRMQQIIYKNKTQNK